MTAVSRLAALIAEHQRDGRGCTGCGWTGRRMPGGASVTSELRNLERAHAAHVAEVIEGDLAVISLPKFPDLDPWMGANLESVQVLREDEDQPWQVYPRIGWLDGPYTPDQARRIGAEWLAAAKAAEEASDR